MEANETINLQNLKLLNETVIKLRFGTREIGRLEGGQLRWLYDIGPGLLMLRKVIWLAKVSAPKW